MMKKTTFTCSA